MALRIFDFLCAQCGNAFEVFAGSEGDSQHCPRCQSPSTARQPVMQMSIRTSGTRRGRLIDMSSNSCPCGCGGSKHSAR
jgi:putative FmdB family regulatory protein